MNQKILSEIKSIATEIENSSDINTSKLKEKVSKLYDKLVVLEFLENSITSITTESTPEKEEEILVEEHDTVTESLDFIKAEETHEEIVVEKIAEEVNPTEKTIEEVIKPKTINSSKSLLHEELKRSAIQIGLNDRIAFVKRLFDGNQQDFHRVLSQVNTFSSFEEVTEFIETMVKPEHNWENQEEYAERFMEIIEMKFQ
jgi:hypothetical protein